MRGCGPSPAPAACACPPLTPCRVPVLPPSSALPLQAVKTWREAKKKKKFGAGLATALRRVLTPRLIAAWLGLLALYW